MLRIPVFGFRILFIIMLLSLYGQTLKHTKIHHKNKQDASVKHTTDVDKTSNNIKKVEQAKKQKDQQESLKEQRMSVEEESGQQKNEVQHDEAKENNNEENMKSNDILDIVRSENHYVVPIKIQNIKYNLSIFYDEKSSNDGQIPSWIFTNLTGKDHQICNSNNDCQDATRFVKCQQSDQQKSDGCVVTGKAVYQTDKMISKKKVKVGFQNNDNQFYWQFASPSKATLADDYSTDEIHGVLNLGMKQLNKIETDIVMISSKKIHIVNHSQIDQKLKEDGVINFVKTGFFHFTNSKNIYITTTSAKNGKITNDIKQSFQKIKIKFNDVNSTMAVPKGMLTVIKNILEKEYFGDRCHDNDQSYVCAAPPVKNITSIMFCVQSGSKNCVNLPIQNLILREEKKNKVFTLLVNSNKDLGEIENSTIILYPPVAAHYQIITKNGVIAGVKPLQVISQEIKQNSDSAIMEKEQNKKQSEQEQTQTQSKAQQEQSQQEVTKQKKSESNTISQTDKQTKISKQDPQLTQQQTHQQQMQSSESLQQLEQKPQKSNNQKNKRSAKSKSQHLYIGSKPNTQQQIRHDKNEYSKTALFVVILYGLIFIVILIIIKLKQKESFAAGLIDRLLDNKLSAVLLSFFNKNQGYNAPKFDDQEEDIDRSDSVTVGYNEKEGRDLFWQKNSVEGI